MENLGSISSRARVALGVCLISLASLPAVPAAADSNGTWSLEIGPPGSYGHSLVLDTQRQRIVAFGGKVIGGAPSNQVWIRPVDGSGPWTRLDVSGGPIGRWEHAAVYDPVRDRMIVFGGLVNGVRSRELWSLSLGGPQWTSIANSGDVPPSVNGHAMAYDPVRDRILLDGGVAGQTSEGMQLYSNNLYSLSLAAPMTWTNHGYVGPRAYHTIVRDPARDRMLKYGGVPGDPAVYAMPLAGPYAWGPLATTNTPAARTRHVAVVDAARDRMIVFSGIANDITNELLALDLGGLAWSVLAPSRPPGRTYQAAAVLDPAGDRLIVFGGQAAEAATQSISFAGAPGTAGVDADRPTWRTNATLVRDAGRNQALLYGGRDAWFEFPRDVWALDLGITLEWQRLPAIGVQPGRHFHRAIFDDAGDRMILFGGDAPGGGYNDVWSLDRTTNLWTRIYPAGTPPVVPEQSPTSAVYDPVRQRMLLLVYRVLWELTLTGTPTWTYLLPAGPLPNSTQRIVYDSLRDRLVACSEYGVWALPLSGPLAWVQVTPDAHPYGLIPMYDDRRDEILATDGTITERLSLANPTAWTTLAPAGTPPPVAGGNWIYDPTYDRAIGFSYADVWRLHFGEVLEAAGSPSRPVLSIAARPNPVRGSASVALALDRPADARVEVFDAAGRRVAVVFAGALPAGRHTLSWSPRDADGRRVGPGVYLVRCAVAHGTVTGRMVVLE